jgi:hypothetical protein
LPPVVRVRVLHWLALPPQDTPETGEAVTWNKVQGTAAEPGTPTMARSLAAMSPPSVTTMSAADEAMASITGMPESGPMALEAEKTSRSGAVSLPPSTTRAGSSGAPLDLTAPP